MPVQNRVRALRAERRWSQAFLAEKAGVARQTINAIENGRSEPGVELALRLARAFGKRVEELFVLEPERVTSRGQPDSPF